MYALRRWSVRHARGLEHFYLIFDPLFMALGPLWRVLGITRLERPVAALERTLKGTLFDCRMCGQCALTNTGMACPMNCPKSLRNGPCGGVRPDGGCEVKPDMACVWVEAWAGSQRMQKGDIASVKPPLDHRRTGRSAWLYLLEQGDEAKEDRP
jgi:hypothetical protein